MGIVDRILYNGTIFTQDIYKPRVSAIALQGDRVVAYGANEDVLMLGEVSARRENLRGAIVIPGLTDAHIHWQQTAESIEQVNLFEVPTKAAALERIAERAAQTPEGQWIRGWGWTQDVWPDKAFPTAADLDKVAPNHPIYLAAKSVHAAWVNSMAMRMCGVADGIGDPEGGQIQRNAKGEPTGILFEAPAMSLVYKNIPPRSIDQIADAMELAQKAALSVGLTGFHDFDDPDCLRALQRLRERGTLSLRAVKNINKRAIDAALDSGLRWGFGDEWIRIGGVKLFADGALGPRTASMIEPYEGEPNNYGIVVTDKEEIQEIVSRASAAGLPATVHAIGDRAVHDVLDVYEAVRAEEAARGEARHTRRHRIEHVQIIHPTDVKRLASLDIIASMQPIHAISDMDMAMRYWGERGQWSYNPRLQLKQGVVVAFGSDSPVDSFDPFTGIHAAVTRRRADGSPGPDGWYPEARVSVEDAVRAYTIGPAYAAGMEGRLGRLAPGYLADLLVLDRDVFHIDPHEIRDVRVLGTMVGGVWRYGGLS